MTGGTSLNSPMLGQLVSNNTSTGRASINNMLNQINRTPNRTPIKLGQNSVTVEVQPL